MESNVKGIFNTIHADTKDYAKLYLLRYRLWQVITDGH